MPKRVQPLSDKAIRNAKPRDKDYCLTDGYGLSITITPTGGKLWRFKYRHQGKGQTISFGAYPEVSLALARERRQEIRTRMEAGLDPLPSKRAVKQAEVERKASTFKSVARDWLMEFSGEWSTSYKVNVEILLNRLTTHLGEMPIDSIKPVDVLAVLKEMAATSPIQAQKARVTASQVFRYGGATGKCTVDPTVILKGALAPPKRGNMATLTKPVEVAHLLRAIDALTIGEPVSLAALKLAPYVFVRPQELCGMEWSELDLDAGVWTIPAKKMKMGFDHLVPLAKQVVAMLREMPVTSGYVFTSPLIPGKPINTATLVRALRRAGYTKEQMSIHGFRAMARTILDEVLEFRPDFIEHQLAHTVKDPNGRAYNRTAHLPARKEMMQTWADYLDGLKQGAKVLPLRRAA